METTITKDQILNERGQAPWPITKARFPVLPQMSASQMTASATQVWDGQWTFTSQRLQKKKKWTCARSRQTHKFWTAFKSHHRRGRVSTGTSQPSKRQQKRNPNHSWKPPLKQWIAYTKQRSLAMTCLQSWVTPDLSKLRDDSATLWSILIWQRTSLRSRDSSPFSGIGSIL